MTSTDTDIAHPDWNHKARTLAEALPYMRRYSGSTFVVKYGGHAMGDEGRLALFAADVVLLKQVGINPVVVHGGGPQIGEMLKRLNIQSSFVEGLRVTDAATMEVVEMVLSGLINKQLVAAINRAGGNAVGLSGKDSDLMQAEQLNEALGFVGKPTAIRGDVLDFLSHGKYIPVIAPVAVGKNGASYNVNADTAAGAIGAAINAERLLFLTDVSGVLDKNKQLISAMTSDMARAHIKDGTITGGMIPKVETCLEAVSMGVKGAVILDGRVPHAILLETFTEGGAGTLIGTL